MRTKQEWMDIRDAATTYGIAVSTIYDWIQANLVTGELIGRKGPGKKSRVEKHSLELALKYRKTKTSN